MSQKVEETLNRIKTHKGVLGAIIVNSKGISLRSTMNVNETLEYGSLISSFANNAARQIKETLHPEEEVIFIRIRSRKHEIMIAPDKEFMMIVLQNPSNDIITTDWKRFY